MLDILGENKKNKILLICVVVSLIGTSSLYVYTARQDAKEIEISDIDSNMLGTSIKTRGFITELDKYQDTYFLVLREQFSTSSIDVMVKDKVVKNLPLEEKKKLRSGSEVLVTGQLSEYQEEYTIQVNGISDLKITKKAYSSFTPISSLLENPEWYEDMEVKVRGDVHHLSCNYNTTRFELSPLEGGDHYLSCSIKGWDYSEDYTITNDDPAVVKGKFLYDSSSGRWVIEGVEAPTGH